MCTYVFWFIYLGSETKFLCHRVVILKKDKKDLLHLTKEEEGKKNCFLKQPTSDYNCPLGEYNIYPRDLVKKHFINL